MSNSELSYPDSDQSHLQASKMFEATNGESYIRAIHQGSTMYLSDLYVPASLRRQGIGTSLLNETVKYAHEVSVDRFIGSITSRQCIDAMTKFFGPDAINIICLGAYEDYAPDEEVPGAAILDYTLPDSVTPKISHIPIA